MSERNKNLVGLNSFAAESAWQAAESMELSESPALTSVLPRSVCWAALVWMATGLCASQLAAEIPVGDYGAVAIDLEAGAEYSSNIALNSLEQDDMVYNFKPLLRYRFDQGALRVDAYAGVNIIRYDDYDENDAEDLKSQVVLDYPYDSDRYEKRYDLNLAFGYNETTSADSAVQAISSVDEINVDLIGRYYYSDRTYLRTGILYLDSQSERSTFYDYSQFSVPVEVFYEYTESLSYGLGYRYRLTDVDSPAPQTDSVDHAVYLAAVGELDPSLTGEIRVGGQYRDFDDSFYDSETAFFMDSSLLWELSDLTWMKISVGNEFGTTISNQSRKTLYARFKLRHSFTEQLDGIVGLSYEEVEYTQSTGDRNDDQWLFELGAIYTLIEDRLSLAAEADYRSRDSDESFADYEASRVRVSIAYLF